MLLVFASLLNQRSVPAQLTTVSHKRRAPHQANSHAARRPVDERVRRRLTITLLVKRDDTISGRRHSLSSTAGTCALLSDRSGSVLVRAPTPGGPSAPRRIRRCRRAISHITPRRRTPGPHLSGKRRRSSALLYYFWCERRSQRGPRRRATGRSRRRASRPVVRLLRPRSFHI